MSLTKIFQTGYLIIKTCKTGLIDPVSSLNSVLKIVLLYLDHETQLYQDISAVSRCLSYLGWFDRIEDLACELFYNILK